MSKLRRILIIIFGICISVLSIGMFAHNAEYILTGNTVDLNEILDNDKELPRGKYVTFICEFPIGNYAETQQYINGIIPLPFKTQQYAMLGNNGMIFSAEIGKKAKIKEMDQAIDTFYNGGTVSVTLTGKFQINSPEMDSYLEECVDYIIDDIEDSEIFLTSYVIDTTQTRLSQSLLYISGFITGMLIVITNIRTLYRRNTK